MWLKHGSVVVPILKQSSSSSECIVHSPGRLDWPKEGPREYLCTQWFLTKLRTWTNDRGWVSAVLTSIPTSEPAIEESKFRKYRWLSRSQCCVCGWVSLIRICKAPCLIFRWPRRLTFDYHLKQRPPACLLSNYFLPRSSLSLKVVLVDYHSVGSLLVCDI